MAERLELNDFLLKTSEIPLIDVRSPDEYKSGHIPLAISIPLFDDDERAIIGTLYKQKGKKPAIKKGLDIVGPKMSQLVKKVEHLSSEEVAIYCWRGGMRSDSVAWLMEQYGIRSYLLEGGYKSFRREMIKYYKRPLNLRIVSGNTGSKKTELLHKIRTYGGQMIDLEGLAQHQGSSFGNQKSITQPTTEHFQNLTYASFRALNPNQPIFIEDECQRIGQVTLTESLYLTMRNSPHILIKIDKQERIDFLVQDYGYIDHDKLIRATEAIKRKLGHDNANTAISHIQEGDLHSAVDILLGYYDKRYEASIDKKHKLIEIEYEIKMEELDSLAAKLAKYAI